MLITLETHQGTVTLIMWQSVSTSLDVLVSSDTVPITASNLVVALTVNNDLGY